MVNMMKEQRIKIQGRLQYGNGYRLACNVDPELTRLYRSFIPKHIAWNIPRYYPHATVVRGKYETPPKKEYWNKYAGEIVEFEYDPYINIDNTYIWLNAFSKRFEEIRLELGLDNCFNRFKWFHITIANTKGL